MEMRDQLSWNASDLKPEYIWTVGEFSPTEICEHIRQHNSNTNTQKTNENKIR